MMHVLRFFPTGGSDGRCLATKIGQREATPGYLRQIATAIDEFGYYGALLPTGPGCLHTWVLASSFLTITERLKFVLSGYPHLEEAYRFAEIVFPFLPLTHTAAVPHSLGETRLNDINLGPIGQPASPQTLNG